jgi:hypothetical protein
MGKRTLRCVRILAFAVAFVVAFGAAPAAKATIFYVSPHGQDSQSGTSPRAAWRTVGRVSRAQLGPGDTVLFRGGAAYGGTLFPRTSGRPGAPITFSSYGGRRANIVGGITLVSKSWIRLVSLRVDTGTWKTAGDTYGVMSHDRGSGSTHISVRNCSFRNVRFGLMLSNHGDRHWLVRNNLIQYTRDSGILIFDPHTTNGIGGDSLLFAHNSILDTGLDSSIDYPKHGVYDKGTNTTFRNNVIRNWSSQSGLEGAALAIRAHSTTIRGNRLSGGPYGVSWLGYDPAAGTTRIVGNRISHVTRDGVSLTWQMGPVATAESFDVAHNVISTQAARGQPLPDAIFTQRTTGSISIAHNVVKGTHRYGLWIDGLPQGRFSEHHNHWRGNHGAERWNYLGLELPTLRAYQLASGQGAADTVG